MADFITPCYEDEIFQDGTDSVTDLHAFYMSQFNIEVENGNKQKAKENLKFDNEESFDFEVLNNWSSNNSNTTTNDFEIIDQVINSNMDEQNIKEVLLDLDNIDFEDQSFKAESYDSNSKEIESFYENNDYIDDESLIDELCREDGESRFTPDYNDTCQTRPTTENILPSIETAFSKPYCHFNNADNAENQMCFNTQPVTNDTGFINNLEQYSYPNNVLYNLDSKKNYILPDTPTSCTEFNFERGDRKVSISESIESDVQSSYYDENSETFDDDELFVNLDDFGLNLERENEIVDVSDIRIGNPERRANKEKSHGERLCFWEHCYEKYPNQSTLVEHIERAHVNTYKGDEFSCLWKDCARARRPFNARYKLLIHMRVHSGHKPNRCHHPGCGKAFSRLENLKIHVRSHTGERPYACPAPHCRKAFSNSSDRAKHQRTHFNARPYACGAAGCGKRYTDPSSLRKHVKSHPHIPNIPRTCLPPSRPLMKPDRTLVPSSPAKLTTLRCIRDKLTIPKLQKI